MSNSLDAILSQYESNTENSSKKPKLSNEDRQKMVSLHSKKYIFTKDK